MKKSSQEEQNLESETTQMDKQEFPERTCVICRKKANKKDFLRFATVSDNYIYDKKQKHQSRGIYCCKTKTCLERLSKHKRYQIPIEELANSGKDLKKDVSNIEEKLKVMAKSEYLVFGMKMVSEDWERVHLLVVANDISEKNYERLQKRASEKKMKIITSGTRISLGKIFGKDEVTVVGVKNKRVVRGILENESMN